MWLMSIEIDHIRFKQEIFKTEEYTGTHTVSCYMIMPYGLQKIPYRLVREGEANRCFCITMEIISSSPLLDAIDDAKTKVISDFQETPDPTQQTMI